MASSGATSQAPSVSVSYKSPGNEPFSFAESLSAPPSDSPEDRAKYLGSLRKTIARVQEQVNRELTARMEEDKGRATSAGAAQGEPATTTVDESKEEENYGEEVQEEDD